MSYLKKLFIFERAELVFTIFIQSRLGPLDDDDVISNSYLDGLYKNSSPTTVALSNALSFTDTIDDTKSYYISNAYNHLI